MSWFIQGYNTGSVTVIEVRQAADKCSRLKSQGVALCIATGNMLVASNVRHLNMDLSGDGGRRDVMSLLLLDY